MAPPSVLRQGTYVLGWLLLTSSAFGQDTRSPSSKLEAAIQLEQQGAWRAAAQRYDQLLRDQPDLPEIQTRLQKCIRHLLQEQRHNDLTYQTQVLSLDLHQSLGLYEEILIHLHTYYARDPLVTPAILFQHGLDELMHALRSPRFQASYFLQTSPAARAKVRARLRSRWANLKADSIAAARRSVRTIALEAQQILNLTTPSVIVLEFACGASNALDAYTRFLTPGQFLRTVSGPLLALEQFGLELALQKGQLRITAVRADSEAEQQYGLVKGDIILRLNDQPIEPPTPQRLAEILRNTTGPIIELAIAHGDKRPPRLVPVHREAASVVEIRMPRPGVGYVRMLRFCQTTPRELEEALISLRMQGLEVLILDLRGNPGGRFLTALELAETFLPDGVIVTTRGRIPEFNRTYVSESGMTADPVPLVVLIDRQTASAAEIFAGALKAHQRALLVGSPSFGKGSIQVVFRLGVRLEPNPVPKEDLSPHGALRITLGEFIAPDGISFAKAGVIPELHATDPDRQLALAMEQAIRLVAMHSSSDP